jgi:hypothetical protein
VLNQLVQALSAQVAGANGGGPGGKPADPSQLPGPTGTQTGGGGPGGTGQPPVPTGPPGLTGANPGGGTTNHADMPGMDPNMPM